MLINMDSHNSMSEIHSVSSQANNYRYQIPAEFDGVDPYHCFNGHHIVNPHAEHQATCNQLCEPQVGDPVWQAPLHHQSYHASCNQPNGSVNQSYYRNASNTEGLFYSYPNGPRDAQQDCANDSLHLYPNDNMQLHQAQSFPHQQIGNNCNIGSKWPIFEVFDSNSRNFHDQCQYSNYDYDKQHYPREQQEHRAIYQNQDSSVKPPYCVQPQTPIPNFMQSQSTSLNQPASYEHQYPVNDARNHQQHHYSQQDKSVWTQNMSFESSFTAEICTDQVTSSTQEDLDRSNQLSAAPPKVTTSGSQVKELGSSGKSHSRQKGVSKSLAMKIPSQGSSSASSTSASQGNRSRPNQCTVCGRNYARPSTLKTHLRTHTNERPFRCNVCTKTFSQAANLTAHQRVHTGERPFSCPICGRQFSQSSSVITHLRTHSGERPYRCNLCHRTFSDSSTLTKHCRIHSGEKPYRCDYCPLNFSQSGNLSRHVKLHFHSNQQHMPMGTGNDSHSLRNNGKT